MASSLHVTYALNASRENFPHGTHIKSNIILPNVSVKTSLSLSLNSHTISVQNPKKICKSPFSNKKRCIRNSVSDSRLQAVANSQKLDKTDNKLKTAFQESLIASKSNESTIGSAIESTNGSANGNQVYATLADFTRFSTEGNHAELQTAIVTYWKRGPWWDLLRPEVQVDLVAAVHIADKEYFEGLQDELATYDRVLYEMVADKRRRSFSNGKEVRWKPPKRKPGQKRGGGGVIGTIQRLMSSALNLEFQLECMDYAENNWYHADLDLATFQKLQKERGESFFSFARDVTVMSSKAIARSAEAPSDLDPFRRSLFWAARFVPMPLLGLFLIEGVCAPRDSPLMKAPEVKALMDLDLSRALKVVLARQITMDTMDKAASVLESSVIIGERNTAAMEALSEALDDGCRRIAIFYGSGHLPDLDRRLRLQFDLHPISVDWRTAWAITGRKREIKKGAGSKFLAKIAKISGWPLNRYQTTALGLFSLVLAVDLWVWEVLLQSIEDYVVQGIAILTAFFDQGWEL